MSLTSSVIKYGFLLKQGGKLKAWRKRWVVLIPGRVLYFMGKPETVDALGSEQKGEIALSASSTVTETRADADQPGMTVAAQGRTFSFCSNQETVVRAWVAVIREQIERLREAAAASPVGPRSASPTRGAGTGAGAGAGNVGYGGGAGSTTHVISPGAAMAAASVAGVASLHNVPSEGGSTSNSMSTHLLASEGVHGGAATAAGAHEVGAVAAGDDARSRSVSVASITSSHSSGSEDGGAGASARARRSRGSPGTGTAAGGSGSPLLSGGSGVGRTSVDTNAPSLPASQGGSKHRDVLQSFHVPSLAPSPGTSFSEHIHKRVTLHTYKGSGKLVGCSTSASGNILASCAGNKVHLWAMGKEEPAPRWTMLGSCEMNDCAVAPEGALTIGAGSDGRLHVWNLRDERADVRLVPGHIAPVSRVVCSADGSLVVSAGHDTSVRVWSVPQDFACIATFTNHAARVHSIGLSVDGLLLMSAADDSVVYVWSLALRKVAAQLHAPNMTAAALNPHVPLVAIGDSRGHVALWPLQTPTARPPLHERHEREVTALAFSSDGSKLASGAADGSLLIWDVTLSDFPCIARASLHTRAITAIFFVPTEPSLVVTASADGTARLISLPALTSHMKTEPPPSVIVPPTKKRLQGEIVAVPNSNGDPVVPARGGGGGVGAGAYGGGGARAPPPPAGQGCGCVLV